MKSWKQPTLLSRNSAELTAGIMILETNKNEGEEYLYYFYKTNENASNFNTIKGVLLASSGIANSIFFSDFREVTFSMNKDTYKATSKTYLTNYLICVIVPSNTPDNITLYILNEFVSFCELFFENFENDSKKFSNILNKYAEILFYITANYTLKASKEDIIGTPISLLPVMNMTFSYNEKCPIFLIKPGIGDALRSDLIEHMNSLNTDRSVLQETLTLMEPPFYLKGYVLLYRGFVVFNTLSNKEMANGARLAMLHEMYMRSQSSPEVLSCEFLFDNENDLRNVNRKKTLATLLAQREFVLIISLEILGKNNCSFDPFYHKRAEDLLVNLLKKSFSSILGAELFRHSIKMSNVSEFENDDEKSVKELKEVETIISNKSQSKTSLVDIASKDREAALKLLTNKIKGYIDGETNVNIIHFSCYDDAECVINTTDLNITTKMYKDVYRFIFNIYAKIQSNINKLKLRNKKVKLSQIFSYSGVKGDNILRKDNMIKMKIAHTNYIKSINDTSRMFKINEYGAKMNNKAGVPIWVCCKVYEHITIEDDINMDEYSNYKIIFVAYEGVNPVETDSFCQDLLMNELFI